MKVLVLAAALLGVAVSAVSAQQDAAIPDLKGTWTGKGKAVVFGVNAHHPGKKTAEYLEWIDALKDGAGRARILVRVERLIQGNPGQYRDLTDGVSELKVDLGPGYRVYYSQRGARLLLLLAGGDKSTQQKDIAKAIHLAKNFQE